jgi:hypothetical protein
MPIVNLCDPMFHLAFQHKDELVLARMRMAVRGLSTRNDACQDHAKILQARVIAETTIEAVLVPRPVRLGNAGKIGFRNVCRIERRHEGTLVLHWISSRVAADLLAGTAPDFASMTNRSYDQNHIGIRSPRTEREQSAPGLPQPSVQFAKKISHWPEPTTGAARFGRQVEVREEGPRG